jgi:hypothetical protein
MVFNVHRPRAFVGAGDSGALLGWGLTSAGHQLGTFARSDVRVTVSLAPVLVRARVSVQGESAVHSVKIQFNGPVACRRFLMWIDACAEARDGE